MNLICEIVVPQESVNDLSVTVMSLLVENGSKVAKNTPLIELESSKTTFTLATEHEGYVEILFQPGDEVQVGQVIAKVFDAPPEKETIAHSLKKSSVSKQEVYPEKTLFSEKARQLMITYKLQPEAFAGYDFVNEDDVKEKVGIVSNKVETYRKQTNELPLGDVEHHTEKLSTAKKREIEYLRHVQSAGLNSQVTVSLNIAGIFTRLNPQFRYLKNSILPIVIYECSRLLRKYPELNAFYNNEQITYYDDVNIGVALDIDDGLKTICLKQADSKDIHSIEEELMVLSEKYLSKTLSTIELSGITFTITDLSAENVYLFNPLINRQNSAILGISSIQENNRCLLTITFDHRVSVGKNVARFLSDLQLRIESYKSAQTTDVSNIKCYKCFKRLDEDFSEIGFAKVINQKGIESYICQTCMKGF